MVTSALAGKLDYGRINGLGATRIEHNLLINGGKTQVLRYTIFDGKRYITVQCEAPAGDTETLDLLESATRTLRRAE